MNLDSMTSLSYRTSPVQSAALNLYSSFQSLRTNVECHNKEIHYHQEIFTFDSTYFVSFGYKVKM